MEKLSPSFRISQPPARTIAGADVESNEPTKPQELDELALMKRLGDGDDSAMNCLIEHHGDWMARLVGRLLAWSPEYEDVFQEALLHVWQKAESFRGTGPLAGWLRRLTINRCHNHLRQQNSIKKLLTGIFNFKQITKSSTCEPEPSSRLQTAMSKMPARDREVLVLYYLEELSGAEVSLAIGISEETLHVRLHRARKKLKSILQEEVDQ